MDDGMQWLAGTILSAVISSVITVGFLSALVTRLQIRIDHRNNGIKRVYAPGEHSRTLKKQLAEARAIQLLALSGYGFTHAYRRILTDCVARGGTVEYLLAQPGTAYMKDAAEIEGRGADSISEEVGETLKLLEAIRRDAAEKAGKQKAEPGRVLVRYFHDGDARTADSLYGSERAAYGLAVAADPAASGAGVQHDRVQGRGGLCGLL